jgi:hypothetical protein
MIVWGVYDVVVKFIKDESQFVDQFVVISLKDS